MHSWEGEKTEQYGRQFVRSIFSFRPQVTEPIVRPSTPPPLPGDELMYHGMFHCLSEMSLLRYLLDPTGAGMWLFHPRIAELRKSNNFLVKILVHRDSEVADRREGLVLIDENPLTHPIPITTPANVSVRYEIGKKNEVRIESLAVSTLSVTLPTQYERHAVIRGKELATS